MGGGNRHPGVARQTDRNRCGHLSRHPLSVGHAFLTNLLTDGGRHAAPADHGADTQRQRDSHDNPDWRVLDGAQHIGFQFLQQTLVVSAHIRQLRHLVGGVGDAEHDATQLAALFRF